MPAGNSIGKSRQIRFTGRVLCIRTRPSSSCNTGSAHAFCFGFRTVRDPIVAFQDLVCCFRRSQSLSIVRAAENQWAAHRGPALDLSIPEVFGLVSYRPEMYLNSQQRLPRIPWSKKNSDQCGIQQGISVQRALGLNCCANINKKVELPSFCIDQGILRCLGAGRHLKQLGLDALSRARQCTDNLGLLYRTKVSPGSAPGKHQA